jgi:hypothetical protein
MGRSQEEEFSVDSPFIVLFLAGVQPGLMLAFVEGLCAKGFSVATVHYYRQGVNAFLYWLLEQWAAGFDEDSLRETGEAQAEVLSPCHRPGPVFATEENVRGSWRQRTG